MLKQHRTAWNYTKLSNFAYNKLRMGFLLIFCNFKWLNKEGWVLF